MRLNSDNFNPWKSVNGSLIGFVSNRNASDQKDSVAVKKPSEGAGVLKDKAISQGAMQLEIHGHESPDSDDPCD